MNEPIESLKASERAQMIEETIPAAKVETLKIEEHEVAAAPVVVGRSQRRQWRVRRHVGGRGKSFALLLVVALLALTVFGVIPSISWWGLLLLIPARSNFLSYRAQRAAGFSTRQTRGALRRALWSLAFMAVIVFNAWGALIPLLLISWGVSLLAVRRRDMIGTPIYS